MFAVTERDELCKATGRCRPKVVLRWCCKSIAMSPTKNKLKKACAGFRPISSACRTKNAAGSPGSFRLDGPKTDRAKDDSGFAWKTESEITERGIFLRVCRSH